MALPPDIDLFLFDIEGTLVDSIDAPLLGPRRSRCGVRTRLRRGRRTAKQGAEGHRRWPGPRPLPGARALVGRIRRSGREVALLTNIGRKSHPEVCRRVRRAGFDISPDAIMTAGRATALYLRRAGARRVFALSEGGAREDLRAAGFRIVQRPPVDAVVVAAHRGCTYRELNTATRLVAAGVPLICCGASLTFRGTYRGDSGLFLGEGAMARAIAVATGERVTTIGKPDPRIFREVLRAFHVPAGRTAMIGDGMGDMEGATRAGLGLRVYVGKGGAKADLRVPGIGALNRRWR